MKTIFDYIISLELSGPFYVIALVLSVFLGVFLYWRAGRHELHDSGFLLDLGFFSAFGGLIFGRMFAFFVEFESFNFSLYKLIFFHRFPGFNFWGFLAGILIFGSIFLRRKKESLWNIFDFTAPAIVFSGLSIYFFNILIAGITAKNINSVDVFACFFYLVLFLTIKRLSTKKRFKGYFSGIFFLAIGAFYAFLNLTEYLSKLKLSSNQFGELLLNISFALFGGFLLYRFSKRNLKNDLKGFFAFLLLNLFNFKRVISSTDEAGRIARFIIFLPYFIFRSILVLLRMLLREVSRTFWEFLYILGLRKY